MSDFVNLAGKIRDLRKNLGMNQEDFAKAVSSHRSTIARWESSLIKNRSTPNCAELCRMAKLAPRFWETIFWFLDDQVPASVVVEYTPEGERHIGPDENGNPLYGVLSRARPNDEKLASIQLERLLRTEHGQKELKAHFAKQLLPIDFESNTNSAIDKLLSSSPDMVRGLIEPDPFEVQPYSQRALESRMRRVLAGMAPGEKALTPQEVFAHKFDPDSEYLAKRRKEIESFHHVLKWNLVENESLGDVDRFFNRVASAGPFKQEVDFCDGRVLIELIIITPSSIFSMMKEALMAAMGKTLIFERIHNKTYKKCLLITAYRDKELDPLKLRELFQDQISAAKTLGITVDVVCGANATVRAMADFIREA